MLFLHLSASKSGELKCLRLSEERRLQMSIQQQWKLFLHPSAGKSGVKAGRKFVRDLFWSELPGRIDTQRGSLPPLRNCIKHWEDQAGCKVKLYKKNRKKMDRNSEDSVDWWARGKKRTLPASWTQFAAAGQRWEKMRGLRKIRIASPFSNRLQLTRAQFCSSHSLICAVRPLTYKQAK